MYSSHLVRKAKMGYVQKRLQLKDFELSECFVSLPMFEWISQRHSGKLLTCSELGPS
jgi:hypothetical protein